MNYSMIRYLLGWIFFLCGFFLLLPCIVAIYYKETVGIYYLVCALICLLTGFLSIRKRPVRRIFYTKEGFVTVSLSWLLLSLIGAVPLWSSGEIPLFVDALFETVSGFTTTGASILADVEALSHCAIFWRSFTHWIGGMGVLVFLLTILPLTDGSNMNLMRAESPGPSISKLVPKLKKTAVILYAIYGVLTVIQTVLLLAGHLSFFEAVTLTFGTVGTGGFGIVNDSMMSYSPYVQNVITVFMLLSGVNFSIYFLLLIIKPGDIFKNEELRLYIIIVFSSIAAITVNIRHMFGSLSEAVRHAAFQVASVITTTGYSTFDYDTWPELSKTILIMLMFTGACAGSTCGGIKLSRILIFIKTFFRELSYYVHPRSTKHVRLNGKPLDENVLRSVHVYLIAYVIIFAGSLLLISLNGFDFTTNFTAVSTTLNNIGPGFGLVGPTCNFSQFSIFSKLLFIFNMLAGRLELFPLLLLITPSTWKKY